MESSALVNLFFAKLFYLRCFFTLLARRSLLFDCEAINYGLEKGKKKKVNRNSVSRARLEIVKNFYIFFSFWRWNSCLTTSQLPSIASSIIINTLSSPLSDVFSFTAFFKQFDYDFSFWAHAAIKGKMLHVCFNRVSFSSMLIKHFY